MKKVGKFFGFVLKAGLVLVIYAAYLAFLNKSVVSIESVVVVAILVYMARNKQPQAVAANKAPDATASAAKA